MRARALSLKPDMKGTDKASSIFDGIYAKDSGGGQLPMGHPQRARPALRDTSSFAYSCVSRTENTFSTLSLPGPGSLPAKGLSLKRHSRYLPREIYPISSLVSSKKAVPDGRVYRGERQGGKEGEEGPQNQSSNRLGRHGNLVSTGKLVKSGLLLLSNMKISTSDKE